MITLPISNWSGRIIRKSRWNVVIAFFDKSGSHVFTQKYPIEVLNGDDFRVGDIFEFKAAVVCTAKRASSSLEHELRLLVSDEEEV